MSKQRPSAEQLAELIAQPHFGRTREVMTPRPIRSNRPRWWWRSMRSTSTTTTRQLANDRYEEIKASIRASAWSRP